MKCTSAHSIHLSTLLHKGTVIVFESLTCSLWRNVFKRYILTGIYRLIILSFCRWKCCYFMNFKLIFTYKHVTYKLFTYSCKVYILDNYWLVDCFTFLHPADNLCTSSVSLSINSQVSIFINYWLVLVTESGSHR